MRRGSNGKPTAAYVVELIVLLVTSMPPPNASQPQRRPELTTRSARTRQNGPPQFGQDLTGTVWCVLSGVASCWMS